MRQAAVTNHQNAQGPSQAFTAETAEYAEKKLSGLHDLCGEIFALWGVAKHDVWYENNTVQGFTAESAESAESAERKDSAVSAISAVPFSFIAGVGALARHRGLA